MSLIFSLPIAMIFATGCIQLDMSIDMIMLGVAIIIAGGLAGFEN